MTVRGNRLKSMQQTVHPPAGMTPKQTEKWLNEQAVLFELSCKQPQQTASNMTLAEYSKYWFENIAPNKLASSTVAREKSDIDRFLPHIGHYKLTELRPEHFRKLYVALRKEKNMINGKPLSELTVEGVHACLCGILSDAVESGLLDHNPAWRTYKYSNIDKSSRSLPTRRFCKSSSARWRKKASSTKLTSSSSLQPVYGAASAAA